MGFIKEFKTFALKGNVVQMAIGVIIGTAFGKIVNSLVSDIVMPPLGLLIGDVDFKDFKLFLKEGLVIEGKKNPDVFITYGNFLQVSFEFLIISIAIFLMMKFFNSMNLQELEKDNAPKESSDKKEILLTEIRDILKNKTIQS